MVIKALLKIKRLEIIDKREFPLATLNKDDKIFVVHIAALAKLTTMPIYPSRQAQVALLTSEKTEIPIEYSDFSNNFSSDSAVKLLEYTGINNHAINLQDDKQPPYGLIYSLGPVELKILKTYIETYLASNFIKPSKSPTSILILFVEKKNSSLHL